MNRCANQRLLAAMLAMACLSSVAGASELPESYLGLNVGAGRLRETVQLQGERVRGEYRDSGSGFAASALAGYMLNPYVGLELQAGQFGSIKRTSDIYRSEIRVRGASAALIGRLPLNRDVALVGKLGGAFARGEQQGTALVSLVPFPNGNPNGEVLAAISLRDYKTHINNYVPVYGLALDWKISPALGAQLAVDHLSRVSFSETGDVDVDRVALGVYWRFGK